MGAGQSSKTFFQKRLIAPRLWPALAALGAVFFMEYWLLAHVLLIFFRTGHVSFIPSAILLTMTSDWFFLSSFVVIFLAMLSSSGVLTIFNYAPELTEDVSKPIIMVLSLIISIFFWSTIWVLRRFF